MITGPLSQSRSHIGSRCCCFWFIAIFWGLSGLKMNGIREKTTPFQQILVFLFELGCLFNSYLFWNEVVVSLSVLFNGVRAKKRYPYFVVISDYLQIMNNTKSVSYTFHILRAHFFLPTVTSLSFQMALHSARSAFSFFGGFVRPAYRFQPVR